ncbi:MAG: hypothetical protein LKF83_02705 [Solobacterium sp.]|jgi:hypothetical protein|nr:hypothetical protein [Solobacterium sp.]
MTDIIRTAAITSAMFLSAISPIGANAKQFNTPRTSTASVSVVSHLYDTSDGSVGRLTIGGYTAELYQSSSQSVVDAADSAAYIPWGNIVMIADHASQGFSVLRSLGAGASGTITDNSTITYITCASSYQGTNTGNGINLADGRYAETVGDGSYMLYTCNDSAGVSVTVTYWYVSGTSAIAPVQQAPVVEEAPVQEAASVETVQYTESQSVVDTTVSEQTQPAQNETAETEQAQPASSETAVTAQNTASPANADKVSTTSVSDFAEATGETNHLSQAELESKLYDLLTANEQDASSNAKTDSLHFYAEDQAYYADNRHWLALSSTSSENRFEA